jgi:lipoate-protein ligase A
VAAKSFNPVTPRPESSWGAPPRARAPREASGRGVTGAPTMTSSCDLYPLLAADGPTQMAADEALLDRAVPGRAGLRFYTWSDPTLSLGYFQRAADRLDVPTLAELPFVRRLTGGGAIVHHHDLTYALALPVAPPYRGAGDWVCRMHDIIRAAFSEFGISSALLGCGREQGRGRFLCFEHMTPGDVVIGDVKVVGSARRKRGTAVLQHGSILLAASPFAPHLRGVRDVAGLDATPADLVEPITRLFSQSTGWSLHECDSNDLRGTGIDRYRSSAWNERR